MGNADPVPPTRLRAFLDELGTLALRPTTRVGLVGVALLFMGFSANLMARTPAYYNTDETAHVGYLSSLSRGHLPEIEDRTDTSNPDRSLASRLEAAPSSLETVWVANHPPGAYLPAVPIVWVTDVLGAEGAVPVALRTVGILFGTVAVGFAYLLGRELAEGNERAGLLAATITASAPHLAYVSGTGLTDSASLAGGLAVTWMAVRMIRLGFTRHRLHWLAAFVTVAWATRLTSAVLAVATVALLTLFVRRHRLRFAVIALLPAVVVTGWYYLRVQGLYGDPAASTYLLNRFDLETPTSVGSTLTQGDRWDDILRGLLFSAPPYRYAVDYVWFRVMKVVAVVAIIGAAAAPVVRWLRSDPRPPITRRSLDDRGTGKVGLCSASVVALSIVLPFAFMTQHMAGGGGDHSRYLLPVVPAAAAIIARVVWSLPRKAAQTITLVLVALAAIVDLQVLRTFHLPQFYESRPALWSERLLSPAFGTLAATVAIVGLGLAVWAMTVHPSTRFFGDEPAVRRDRPRPARPRSDGRH